MTDQPDRPLTRADIVSAVTEALQSITVRTETKPTYYVSGATFSGLDAFNAKVSTEEDRAEAASKLGNIGRHESGSLQPTRSDLDLAVTSLRHLLNSLREVFDSFGELLDTGILRADTSAARATSGLGGLLGSTVVGQNSAPSDDGCGDHTVGDGQVAGVENAALVTDATKADVTPEVIEAVAKFLFDTGVDTTMINALRSVAMCLRNDIADPVDGTRQAASRMQQRPGRFSQPRPPGYAR
ncbi:hypothetical protein ACFVWF_32905 [Rhodococcus qingshengii]|uniref:hypothetical protein n=1 Tax=Rhodococcus qingshengii TaxID=334542 RepID=UPI0036DCA44A